MFARELLARSGSEEASSEKLLIGVKTRLQFLSFIYSTLGSPRDFGLVESQLDPLWNSLVDLGERSTGVRDDLFNWILAHARIKEQHALSVEDFRRVFAVNMNTSLEPDSFSQIALLLYQEFFKIYKFSSEGSEATTTSGAIEYVWKPAFRSANREVGISAIQFLNNHFIHSGTAASIENETRFVELCMCYLDEALGALGERRQMSLAMTPFAQELFRCLPETQLLSITTFTAQ